MNCEAEVEHQDHDENLLDKGESKSLTNNEKQSNSIFRYILLFLLAALGAAATLIMKYQDSLSIVLPGATPEHWHTTEFHHPFIQTWLMFIGESGSIWIYLLSLCSRKQRIKMEKEREEAIRDGLIATKITAFCIPFLPALLDLFASIFLYISLFFLHASVIQISQGLIPLVTAGFAVLLLKIGIKAVSLFAFGLIIIGLIIVQISEFFFAPVEQLDSDLQWKLLSLLFLILAIGFHGLQLVVEEVLFEKYYISPALMAGMEGIWGVAMSTIAVVITCAIPCGHDLQDQCAYNPKMNTYKLEDFYNFMEQIQTHAGLLFSVVLVTLVFFSLDLVAINVTKYFSALTRSVIHISQSLIVWIVGLIVTATTTLQWENLDWRAILVESVGFLIVAIAILIYSNVIKVPCMKDTTFCVPKRKDQENSSVEKMAE